jgi:hypothetical protein
VTHARHLHPDWLGFGLTIAVLGALLVGATYLKVRRREQRPGMTPPGR